MNSFMITYDLDSNFQKINNKSRYELINNFLEGQGALKVATTTWYYSTDIDTNSSKICQDMINTKFFIGNEDNLQVVRIILDDSSYMIKPKPKSKAKSISELINSIKST